ncbi:MAG: hypothetical protein ACREOO_07640 [bacterium]
MLPGRHPDLAVAGGNGEWYSREPAGTPRKAATLDKEARIANNVSGNRTGGDQLLRDTWE